MKHFFKIAGMAIMIFLVSTGSVYAKDTIKISHTGNDTGQIHGRIAGFVLEHAYGYNIQYVPGKTITLLAATAQGSIDIYMEFWLENFREAYEKFHNKGKIVNLGMSLLNSWQGFLVPTYMVKGDKKRGIKPTAPDLKSIEDLPRYWELFRDPEDPKKGRFYSCIPGWACQIINEAKFKIYGLDKYYNIFLPGSDAALSGSMVGAYKKGKPWFGYYWQPTWALGMLDMTAIKEPEFNKDVWDKNYGCAYPSVPGRIIVNAGLIDRVTEEVIEFLKNYETSLDMNNKFLAYMQSEGASIEETALWFLKNYRHVWHTWLPQEQVQKVENHL